MDRMTFKGSPYDDSYIKKLQAYEDTGLTPEQVKHFFAGYLTADEAKAMYEDEKQRYDEWFTWKRAEAEGRLIVLPCKVGDDVYRIIHWRNPKEIEKGRVSMLQQKADGSWKFRFSSSTSSFDNEMSIIGETVFLSYEEAKAALFKE